MSLYNLLFGRNAFAFDLLSLIGLKPEDTGRFRDCYVSKARNSEELVIVVYTRNGGGNREEYQGVLDDLSQRPGWLCDYDDDYDCTYASIEFRVPEAAKPLVTMLHGLQQSNISNPGERFQKLIDDLNNGAKTDEGKRALEVGKKILEPIIKHLESGEAGIKEIQI